MRENLKFYSSLPEVDMHQVVNFEARVRQLASYPRQILIKFVLIIIREMKLHAVYLTAVAYQGILFGGRVQQIQLRTE